MAKKETIKERIIYTTLFDVDDWEDDFKDWLDENGFDEDDCDIYNYIDINLVAWFNAEKANLNKPIDGDILVIADLGLWDGRHSAYKIIHASKLSDIFSIGGGYDDMKFYCDQHNLLADLYHHDGVNHLEFRLIKKGVNITPLTDKLYNQEEVSRETIRRYTTSLRKHVAKVYGWK